MSLPPAAVVPPECGSYGWASLIVLLVAAGVSSAACGKKGAPLAPLHLVPAAPTGLSAQLAGADMKLRLVLPSRNQNGGGAIELDRLEIYAVTLAPGAPAPPNRDLLTPARLVGTIPVKPLPVEGEEPPANAAPDTRPLPGAATTFTERLTEATMKPVVFADKTPAAPLTAAPPATTPAIPVPTYPIRVYAVRGVAKGGRAGQPSSRVEVPLVSPPPAPTAVTVAATEQALVVSWTAPSWTGPPAAPDGPAVTFNVYQAGTEGPLNPAPLAAAAFERAGVTFGVEACATVRSVITVAGVPIESDPSAPACVTPNDTFPPAAPKGLTTVSSPGAINLLWDANTEPDLGGYVILRGEAPGDTLQPLTQPITGTRFEDKTVKPGVRYIYAVVAVDKATPPNTSAQSPRQEETAR